ncbi:MAG: hypothetical protein RIF41_11030, partial [Polyangiaceae bacterium]
MSRVKYRYAKVSRRIWSDAAVRDLTPPPPCGQSLWLWLLTCKEQSLLPGLIAVGEAGMAEALGWPLEGFRKAFREVSAKPLAKADWKARLVWVPKAIEHNAPASPNVILSWANAWDEIPECALKHEAYRELRAWAKGAGEAWLKAFDKACPKPSANQEQEQDQDQEQDQEVDLVEAEGSDESTSPSEVDDAWGYYVEGRAEHLAGAPPKLTPERRRMIKRTLSEHDLPEVREATEYFWHPDSPWHAQYHGPSYLFGRTRGDDPQLAKVLAWGRGRGLAQPKQPL